MTALPHIQYFLGANSPTGFYSLYDQLLPPEQARAIYILKGGPGCGKSTLMRRVAAQAGEAGLAVERILCSGDPGSLDAVVIPELGVALVDGTAPHVGVTKGHRAEKVRFCSGLLARFCCGTYTGVRNRRTILEDELFEIRRNCSIEINCPQKAGSWRIYIVDRPDLPLLRRRG